MKTHLVYTLVGLFCFSISINAQITSKEPKSKIGIHTTFIGGNDVFRFDELDGAGSQDGKGFYTFGASYTYILNSRIELQSGIEFSRHKIKINPAFIAIDIVSPPWNENVKLLTVPLTANINFGKYIFLNGGFLLDFEIAKKSSIDKQSGVGAVLGIGAKYDFDSNISIFANPYYKIHSLIPFSSDNYHQRMQEYGVKIGVAYSF